MKKQIFSTSDERVSSARKVRSAKTKENPNHACNAFSDESTEKNGKLKKNSEKLRILIFTS